MAENQTAEIAGNETEEQAFQYEIRVEDAGPGAIAAASKVGLLLNVRRDDLNRVLDVLPALKKPTISTLSDPEWVAVNTIIEESVVRQILPKLKAANAQGIVEYPLNKIVL